MDYENEKEIDLLDLILNVLFKWRSILVVALICFAAFGGYKYYTTEQGRAANDKLIAEGRELEVKYPDSYQDALDEYKANQTTIRKINARISEYQLLIDNANEKISMANKAIEEKQARVEEANEKLAEYQKTVLSDKTSADYATYIGDFVNLTDTVNTISDSITTQQAEIKAQKEIILTNQNLITEEEKNLDKPQREAFDLEEAVEKKTPSQTRSLKDGLKFAIIGFFVGAILTAGIYCLGYVLNGKIHTSDDITAMFNLPLLAQMNRQKPKRVCFIDRWFISWRGDNKNTVSDEDRLKTASVSLNTMVKKDSKVALLTSVALENAEAIEKTLTSNTTGIKFVTVVGSTKSDKSAKLLSDCDSIILLEKREASRYSDVEEEIRQAKLLNKSVIGCIIC